MFISLNLEPYIFSLQSKMADDRSKSTDTDRNPKVVKRRKVVFKKCGICQARKKEDNMYNDHLCSECHKKAFRFSQK